MGEYWQVYHSVPNKWLERKARKGQSMYYYYAYIENGLCVDVERTRKQKTDLTDYVEVSQAEYDAYMNEEMESENYIIGKKWNGTAWVLPEKYYYAIIDDRMIAIDMIVSDDPIERPDYISIAKEEYEGRIYIHFKWDVEEQKFKEVPFVEYADTDTTMVSVNNTNTKLQTLLEQIQSTIENIDCEMAPQDILKAILSVDGSGSGIDADKLDGNDSSVFAKATALAELTKVVNGKAPSVHTHDYAASKHTHADYATKTELTNALAKKANSTHDHSLASHIQVAWVEGDSNSERNSNSVVTLNFSPDIVIVVPDNGVEFSTWDKVDVYGKVSYFYGGVFVKNVNAQAYRGCTISGKNVTLYSDVTGDYEKILMNTYNKIVIGIKI